MNSEYMQTHTAHAEF